MDETKGILQNQFQPFLKLKSHSDPEDVYYSILYEGLPEKFQLIAETELNETEEKRKRGLKYMEVLLKNENVDLDNNILLAVLRSCKYNLKKSKAKLRNFIDKRQEFIEELGNLDMENAEKIIDDMPIGVLPYRDKHGRLIIYTRPNGFSEEHDLNDMGLCVLALLQYLLTFPITTVAGLTYFGECESPSYSIYIIFFKGFKRYIRTILAFPIRIKRVEVLNEVPVIRWFYKIMKPLFPEKLNKRVSFHGSGYGDIHKHYDPNFLPDTFGGKLGPLSSKLYKYGLLDYIRQLKTEGQSNVSPNKEFK